MDGFDEKNSGGSLPLPHQWIDFHNVVIVRCSTTKAYKQWHEKNEFRLCNNFSSF